MTCKHCGVDIDAIGAALEILGLKQLLSGSAFPTLEEHERVCNYAVEGRKELKPCPFCNGMASAGDVSENGEEPSWSVSCDGQYEGDQGCGGFMCSFRTREAAIAAWNQRVEGAPKAFGSRYLLSSY